MYTIEDGGKEYPALWMAIMVAQQAMRTFARSVVIRFNGEPVRLLRY